MSRKCAAVAVLEMNAARNPEIRMRQTTMRRAVEASTPDMAEERNIPVVVHVLYNDPRDNVSDEQIASQIEVLNRDFNNENADLENVPGEFQDLIGNSGIKFHLADDGIIRTQVDVAEYTADDSMKFDSQAHDPERHMNIWVCRLAGGLLGYAQFPEGGDKETDGVVITSTAFGVGGIADDPFDLGRTAVHEVGHYLGLYHIWGNSLFDNCNDDDDVADTPVQRGPNVGKPIFPAKSCANEPHGDMFMNYMDYVDDDTMVMFSTGQVARMRSALAVSRPDLGV